MKGTNKVFHPIFWGVVLVLTAVVMILDGIGLGFGYGITPWRILIGVLLGTWLLYEMIRLKFTNIFFPLAFLFITFKGPLAIALGREGENIISNWVVLLAALLLTIGFKVIFRRKRVVTVNGKEYTIPSNQRFGKIGHQTLYFDATDLSNAVVTENLGYVEVFINNRDAYPGDGMIRVAENLGKISLHIPGDWNVVTQSSENLGFVNIPNREFVGDKTLTLMIMENLGHIDVIFDE